MGKYKSKLRHKTHRYGGHYNCRDAPSDVSFWCCEQGTNFDRKLVKIGDVVRILIQSNGCMSAYVKVCEIRSGDYMVGVIRDPYYGYYDATCDICGYKSTIDTDYNNNPMYTCCKNKDYTMNIVSHICDYDVCKKCYIKNKKAHEHGLVVVNWAFSNGTIIRFKRSEIIEINGLDI